MLRAEGGSVNQRKGWGRGMGRWQEEHVQGPWGRRESLGSEGTRGAGEQRMADNAVRSGRACQPG